MNHSHQGFGHDFWQEHFNKFKASGLNQLQYASRHGLKHKTLNAWVRRFEKKARGQSQDKSLPQKSDGSFARVVVAKDALRDQNELRATPPAKMRLTFPGGHALEIDSDFDSSAVARLVAALGGKS